MIEAAVNEARSAGQGIVLQYAQWTTAILHNGLGRYADALPAAQEASEIIPQLFISGGALPELIEAATRSGQTQVATGALDRFADTTQGERYRMGTRDRGTLASAAE